jgi:hypothetical protein
MCFACQDLASHMKFPRLPIFSVFALEQRPFHVVNQEHKYGQLIYQSQGFICIYWCGSIMPFPFQDAALCIKISQITYFLPCFLRKKDPFTRWMKDIDMVNQCLWAKLWFSYSGVVVSRVLLVKNWLHAWRCQKLPLFSSFSWDNRPLNMVKEKKKDIERW